MGCCGIPDTLPLLQCLYTHRLAFLGNTLDTGLGDSGLQGDYSRSFCADPIGGSAIATANCITMQDAVFCWVFSAHRAHLALAAALCATVTSTPHGLVIVLVAYQERLRQLCCKFTGG